MSKFLGNLMMVIYWIWLVGTACILGSAVVYAIGQMFA
jgi:hypothetical protein